MKHMSDAMNFLHGYVCNKLKFMSSAHGIPYNDAYIAICHSSKKIESQTQHVSRYTGTPIITIVKCQPGRCLNIKQSFLVWDFNYKDKTVMRLTHLYNGNSYTGKTALFWDDPCFSKRIATKTMYYCRPFCWWYNSTVLYIYHLVIFQVSIHNYGASHFSVWAANCEISRAPLQSPAAPLKYNSLFKGTDVSTPPAPPIFV